MLGGAAYGTQNIFHMDMTCHIVPMQTLSERRHMHARTHKHSVTKSSTWTNSLSAWAHIKSLSFIVMAPFSTVFPLSSLLFSFTTDGTAATTEAPVPLCVCVCVCHLYCLPVCIYVHLCPRGCSLIRRSACLCFRLPVCPPPPVIYTTCLTAVRLAFCLPLCV